MSIVYRDITVEKKHYPVGFKCGLCKEDFVYWEFWNKIAGMKASRRGSLSYEHEDGDGFVSLDLCRDCFYKIRDVVKAMGAIIDHDG